MSLFFTDKKVKEALTVAIMTLLTPKKSIDVLRAALAAKSANKVYSIVFLGVNGVGKSTNLAKVRERRLVGGWGNEHPKNRVRVCMPASMFVCAYSSVCH